MQLITNITPLTSGCPGRGELGHIIITIRIIKRFSYLAEDAAYVPTTGYVT